MEIRIISICLATVQGGPNQSPPRLYDRVCLKRGNIKTCSGSVKIAGVLDYFLRKITSEKPTGKLQGVTRKSGNLTTPPPPECVDFRSGTLWESTWKTFDTCNRFSLVKLFFTDVRPFSVLLLFYYNGVGNVNDPVEIAITTLLIITSVGTGGREKKPRTAGRRIGVLCIPLRAPAVGAVYTTRRAPRQQQQIMCNNTNNVFI